MDKSGPAFPSGDETGMTLREYYAGQALPMVIRMAAGTKLGPEYQTAEAVAQASVEFADALIAKLEETTL